MPVMDKIFGFSFLPKNKQAREEIARVPPSPVIPPNYDGAFVHESSAAFGGWQSFVLDIDGYGREESDLIQMYRQIAKQPEAEAAIDDIVNEAICMEDDKQYAVEVDVKTDNETIRKTIQKEFNDILALLDFETCAYDIFKQWYIDGRIAHFILLDKERPKDGIKEIRQMCPFAVRKNVEYKREKTVSGVEMVSEVIDYYVYTPNSDISNANNGIKLHADSVSYVTSGEIMTNRPHVESSNNRGGNPFKTYAISHLHKAIKPINQLRMLEDSIVIHRLVRAPERLVFNIDTGNLPPQKAQEYAEQVKQMTRNKLVYDGVTGQVSESTNQLSMLDNIFIPKSGDGKGVDISTIGGSTAMNYVDDVLMFRQKVYKALNVPVTRMEPEAGFSLGRSSEITRDEVKFAKFIARLRNKFSEMFYNLLRVQLIAKGYTNRQEWEQLKKQIRFVFNDSSYFAELKNIEILDTRLDMLDKIQNYAVGDNMKFFTKDFIMREVLKMSEEEIATLNKVETDQPPEGGMDDMGGDVPPGEEDIEGEGDDGVEPEIGGENVAELFQK